MRRPFLRAACAAFWLFTLVTGDVADAAPCWLPPVSGPVIDPFRAPLCPYCAGNRGIEYRTSAPAVVRSVGAGRVTFSGMVAGTGYVVVETAEGWRLTYGGLSNVAVERGARVGRGIVLGLANGRLHFGLRVNGEYRDPAGYLGDAVGRPHLVPTDGTAKLPRSAEVRRCRR